MNGGIMSITIRRLDSGYWHIRGVGPCNWAQPPCWPCAEETLRGHAAPGASEEFFATVINEATKLWERIDDRDR